ncbi:hypothetical protein BCR39DRAFT_539585, partial [Naematelia encephala]
MHSILLSLRNPACPVLRSFRSSPRSVYKQTLHRFVDPRHCVRAMTYYGATAMGHIPKPPSDAFNARALSTPSSSEPPFPPSPTSPTSPQIGDLESGLARQRHRISRSVGGIVGKGGSSSGGYHWLAGAAGDAKGGRTGDEQGVNVKSKRDQEAYAHLTGRTKVTVVDYTSSTDEEASNLRTDFEGSRLQEWLDSDVSDRATGEDGKPKGVRWIHIEGINWEVIKTLTLTFGLHPLAVEDLLRAYNTPRSKLDFYKSHLYLQLLIQHTHPGDEALLLHAADALPFGRADEILNGAEPGNGTQAQGSKSGVVQRLRDELGGGRAMRLPEGVEGVFEPSAPLSERANDSQPLREAHRLTLDELSAKYMIPVRRAVCSIFLTRDGTLISVSKSSISEVLHPIYDRLGDDQSLLRRSGDVSMLAEALLDVSVDLAIEISQTFEAEILKLEASVLVDPSMGIVRHLHVLSSQLIRLRRTLTPLLHLVYTIRDQDLQRSAAASAMLGHRASDKNHQQSQLMPEMSLSRPGSPGFGRDSASVMSGFQQPPGAQAVAFFSPMSKVYIADVIDHLEIVVSSMDQYVATCDHLTDYVFNALSFQTNASMERLSIVTVVFLPLTFIASYFGMNFTGFAELQGSVSYFWKVAAPATTAFFIIFSASYLRRGVETAWRRLGRWRRTRMIEKAKARRTAGSVKS